MYLDDKQLDSGALGRRILADPLVSSELAGKAAWPRVVNLPWWVRPKTISGVWSGNEGVDSPSTTAILGGYRSNYGQANSDTAYLEYEAPLESGTYQFGVLCGRSATRGILTVYINGSSAGTVDMYAASTGNAYLTISGITVSTSQLHTIKLQCPTKNASSSSYTMLIHAISMTRTGA